MCHLCVIFSYTFLIWFYNSLTRASIIFSIFRDYVIRFDVISGPKIFLYRESMNLEKNIKSRDVGENNCWVVNLLCSCLLATCKIWGQTFPTRSVHFYFAISLHKVARKTRTCSESISMKIMKPSCTAFLLDPEHESIVLRTLQNLCVLSFGLFSNLHAYL